MVIKKLISKVIIPALLAAALLTVALVGQSSSTSADTVAELEGCVMCGPEAVDGTYQLILAPGPGVVQPVPASSPLDPFYEKYVDAAGIPVIGSGRVNDEALLEARRIIVGMLQTSPDIRAAMIANGAYVGIMAETEVTTDIPEHRFLKYDPNQDWDKRARGLGAVLLRPITTGAEENVLCKPADKYHGENILIHEFAHSILNLGIPFVAGGTLFHAALQEAYEAALADGKWMNTYAATNLGEYWAEGVQSWFDANASASPPNGIHNHVDTRWELERYDPTLASLIRLALGQPWRYACP